MRYIKLLSDKDFKRKLRKKCAVLCAVGLLSMVASGTDVAAKSSVSGKLGGFGYHGGISTNSTSATAVTNFGRGNSVIKVSAEIFYWSYGRYYKTSASNSASVGGASATAKKKMAWADVAGGRGTHSVSYDKYSWGPVKTETGILPTNFVVK